MILTSPHIVFYNRDNEIVAGVVEMPKESDFIEWSGHDSKDKFDKEAYEKAIEQALTHPIPFKEKKDEEKVKYEIWSQTKGLVMDFIDWIPELGKPYKFEGEIEIEWQQKRKDQDDTRWIEHVCWPWDKRNLESKIFDYRQVAFLKPKEKAFTQTASSPNEGDIFIDLRRKPKDVLDTGARLPEQKESQEKLLDDVLSLQGMFTDQGVCYDGNRSVFLEKLKSKFVIHRKP